MKERFDKIIEVLEKEKVNNDEDLLSFKKKYKDIFNTLNNDFKLLDVDEKRKNHCYIQTLREKIDSTYKQFQEEVTNKTKNKNNNVDYTLPPYINIGHRHPLSILRNHIITFFHSLGFQIFDTNEIEDDWHNFTALNIPYDHPARDMQDTFFLDKNKDLLLRTHTTTSQIRALEKKHLPVRGISIGKVYRNENISARANNFFHQFDGFCVDKKVSFVEFKYVLHFFLQYLFGEKVKINVRSSFFPFTSPSVELDIRCLICNGDGCAVCKHSGWLEILGGGLIHKNVLQNCNIDPMQYSGYAFGGGIERVAMLLYKINDLRLFSENDLHFLQQF